MMNRLLLLAAAALSCALAACNLNAPDPSSTGSPVTQAIDTVTIRGTQGLVIAELAYEPVAYAATAYLESGAASAEAAAKIQRINRDVRAALDAARAAKSGAEQAIQVGKALAGIADLKASTPVPPH